MNCIKCGKQTNNDKDICDKCQKAITSAPNLVNNWKKELINVWIISIVVMIVIFALGMLIISSLDLGSGWTGFGNAVFASVILVIANFLIPLIYIIINTHKMIKKSFSDSKIFNMYVKICIITILGSAVIGILIFIPFIYLLAATIVLILEDKKKSSVDTAKTDKKIYISICLIFLALILINVGFRQLNNHPELYNDDDIGNKCGQYISSTNEYVYCKTTNRIKRISLKDKDVKFYGNYVTYYSDLVYDDYITYTSEQNSKYKDLYSLNVKTGEEKKIKKIDIFANIDINIQGNNEYISVFTGTSHGLVQDNYVYDLKGNKLTKLSKYIDSVLYATGDELYYCKEDFINIYNVKSKKDNITTSKCSDDVFLHQVGDEDVYYNQYRVLARDGKLYIYNALDEKENSVFENENKDYYFLYYYNKKVYAFFNKNEDRNVGLDYYDFEEKRLVNTDLLIYDTISNGENAEDRYYMIIMKDNIMYYLSKDNIYTYDLKAGIKDKLIDYVESFEGVNNGYVYYFDKNKNFSRYNLKTKKVDIIEKQ